MRSPVVSWGSHSGSGMEKQYTMEKVRCVNHRVKDNGDVIRRVMMLVV